MFFFTVIIYDCPCQELQWFISYHWQTGNWIWPILYKVALLLCDILRSVTAIKSLNFRLLTCLNMQNLTINFRFEFIIRNCPVSRHKLLGASLFYQHTWGNNCSECCFKSFVDRKEDNDSNIKRSRPGIVVRVRNTWRQSSAAGRLPESSPVNSNRLWVTNMLHRHFLR